MDCSPEQGETGAVYNFSGAKCQLPGAKCKSKSSSYFRGKQGVSGQWGSKGRRAGGLWEGKKIATLAEAAGAGQPRPEIRLRRKP